MNGDGGGVSGFGLGEWTGVFSNGLTVFGDDSRPAVETGFGTGEADIEEDEACLSL